MPLPTSGQLTAAQVATEFGISTTNISIEELGTNVNISAGDPVNLPQDFYGRGIATPTVITVTTNNVTNTSMQLQGNVTSTGSAALTERGFYFGTNSSNYLLNPKILYGTGPGGYFVPATGLTPATLYYATAFASNSFGEGVGGTISRATTGGATSPDSGSLVRTVSSPYSNTSIVNRLIQPSIQEPTTALRMGVTTAFTLNFWIRVGWNSSLNGNQFLWGTAANAINPLYFSNVYNHNFRMWYAETNNRVNFSWLGMNQANSATGYSQNFWWLHKNTGTPNAANVTGLGTTYWSNTNRGYINNNGFTMITITHNGSMAQGNLKMYWNGADIGTPYYAGGQNGGQSTYNNTSLPRLTTLLGSPYGPNSSTLGGTGDNSSGRDGGNGNTIIDEYSLWNSALSSTAVTALYNGGAGGSISKTTQPSGLITYYSFDSNTQATPGGGSPQYATPVWPSGGTIGNMYLSGSSAFGSGNNTVNG